MFVRDFIVLVRQNLPECSSVYRLNIKHWINRNLEQFSELEVYRWGRTEYLGISRSNDENCSEHKSTK